MRTTLVIIGVAVIIGLGAVIWSWSSQPSARGGDRYAIELSDLPTGYCPNRASYAVAATQNEKILVYEGTVSVKECKLIELPIPKVERSWNAYVQLPMALWSVLSFPGFGTQQLIPVLGDVNHDNAIDNIDERLVSEQLMAVSQDLTVDTNQDGKIDSYDLALTRLHYGVGATRPDGKGWPKEDVK